MHINPNPTNLALFRHKIALYRFNHGLILLQGAQMGAGGAEPPHFNHWTQLPRETQKDGDTQTNKNIINIKRKNQG